MMSLRGSVILLSSAVVGLQTFTQVLAYKAHYAQALGSELWQGEVFYRTHAVYWPWRGVQWAWRWGTQAPDTVRLAVMIALLPLVIGIGLGMLMHGARRSSNPPALTGHGTTQWATRQDLKEAGLL